MTSAFGTSGEGGALATSAATTWPVVIEARHVRLSAAHIEMLFGADHSLLELVPLAPTGRFASADVVDVRGPSGPLKSVRVLGPVASTTRVYLSDDDVVDCGLGGDRGAGVSIDGPRGTLVLAAGAVFDVRRLVVPRGVASGPQGDIVDVLVRAERARELRGVSVERNGDAQGSANDEPEHGPWLALDVANANALEVGPQTRATASSRG